MDFHISVLYTLCLGRIPLKPHTLAGMLVHFQQNQANKSRWQLHYFFCIDYLSHKDYTYRYKDFLDIRQFLWLLFL